MMFKVKVKGLPVEVYAATQQQAELAKAYIEKTHEIPDMSPAAQAARMANALYEAKQRDKNNKNERTENSSGGTKGS